MDFKKLNLDMYICKKLKILSDNIDMQWDVPSATPIQLKHILINLFSRSKLKSRDLSKLLCNILEVKNILAKEKLGSLEEFFIKLENSFNGNLESERIKNLDIFYDTVLVFYNNKIAIKSINLIINKLLSQNLNLNKNVSKKTKIIFEIIENEKNILDFFVEKFFIKQRIYLNNSLDFELDFYIGKSTELFFDIIKNILYSYIRWIVREQNLDINRQFLKLMKENINNLSEKIEIYKKIINIYSDNIKLDLKADLWFYEILDQLGEIKSTNREWELFTFEEKNIFKKWFFGKKIYDAFKNVNDPERGEFWKSYAHYIVDFKMYEKVAQAIIMEFENHTVVEFGKVGNAAYVYPRHVLSVNKVNGFFNHYSNTTIRDIKLKDKSVAIPLKSSNLSSGWNHPGNWQQAFRYKLSELGYR
ncbi:MAG: hypothetical protein ACRC0R_03400 [Cetobacterium sp.]